MATPETFRALLAANSVPQRVDALPFKTKNLCRNVNETLYKFAHEPSLAGHRIQEHTYKIVPSLCKDQDAMTLMTRKINATTYDLVDTGEFLDNLDQSIENSANTRERISELASKISARTSRTTNTGNNNR